MADASSIRKASSLPVNSQDGFPFYDGAIRWYDNQAWVCSVDADAWLAVATVPPAAYKFVVTLPVGADGYIFTADRAYNVTSISEVHSASDSDGAGITLDVTKVTGTGNLASGVSVIATPFQIGTDADVDTVVTKASTATLAAGNRLAIKTTRVAAYVGAVTLVLTEIV